MNEFELEPIADRIVVEEDKADESSKGGILIPEAAREKQLSGTVLAVGNGRVLDDGTMSDFTVAVGDRVLFSPFAGTRVLWRDKTYLCMREEDLLCRVNSPS